jgi:3-oxoacyl-[acyl-carrier-protein] synthase III
MTVAADKAPAIIGVGYAVPPNIRTNDDPIFDWIKKHQPHGTDLFKGYKERHVLSDGEKIMDYLVPAAEKAIDASGVARDEIDLLLGDVSVSEYITPNELAQLHAELSLSERTWILPFNNEFSNFNASLAMASALIAAGRARNALLACASNWTRYVNYHTPPAVSAADGAGAAVMGATSDRSRFRVVDFETVSDTSYYGTMYMQPDRDGKLYTAPFYHITDAGQQGFVKFGETQPINATNRLLARNNLTGADIALMSHQASIVLLQAWQDGIKPAQYLQTLEQFANATLATIPMNLACLYDQIKTDWLVLLGIGADMHTNALLLQRNG